MKHSLLFLLLSFCLSSIAQKSSNFTGLEVNMSNLYRLSDAKTHSISPENFTGEPGKGGIATLDKGVHGHQALFSISGLLVPGRTTCSFS